MCRFVLYMGPSIQMDSLITKPSHSIIVQSYHANEIDVPLNGDGFGVAWYQQGIDEAPALFRSISPAWNNQNLINLSHALKSHCILAHVRAASPGLPVTQLNCHPFTWKQFSFMHNGFIGDFQTIKRRARNLLSESSYRWIQGSTDSETFFALFIDKYQQISTGTESTETERIAAALTATIRAFKNLFAEAGITENWSLNLVISDGQNAVATRYSSPGTIIHSLYLHTGASYRCDTGDIHLAPSDQQTILIASEPLTNDPDWHEVEANYLIKVDNINTVELAPVPF